MCALRHNGGGIQGALLNAAYWRSPLQRRRHLSRSKAGQEVPTRRGRANGEAGLRESRPGRPSFLHPVCAPRALARRCRRARRIQRDARHRGPPNAEPPTSLSDGFSASELDNSLGDTTDGSTRSRGNVAGARRTANSAAVGRAGHGRPDRATTRDAFADRAAGALTHAAADKHAAPSDAAAPTHHYSDPRTSMTGHVSTTAIGIADHRSARIDHKRLETVISALRLVGAAGVLLLGQAVPNVGPLFVLVLGVFLAGYGLLVILAWARVRTAADREQASRFTLAADISLVGFALFVFAPDPSWTVYACG